ncbi:MAG: DUF1493 family protein [Saprospiraceae bacterium]|nr:DUF1493 family protein [Saprospiraceae bacterium]MBK7789094.1 DUF1493 family protein [Saprospiraceae bacterium]MBK8849733.1 DUF1493 family protein [Saprospiraceae bacterium]
MTIFGSLKNFVSEEFGIDESRITLSTDLQSDLNIYGDDASEFISLFAKQLNVDIKYFNFDEYFKGEGSSLMEFLGHKSVPVYKKLLIQDLVLAVELGYLK